MSRPTLDQHGLAVCDACQRMAPLSILIQLCSTDQTQPYRARCVLNSEPDRDYFYLCCECGEISPYSLWEHLKEDEDGALVPIDDGDTDSYERCPSCGHVHRDDESGAGVSDGTVVEVKAYREWLVDNNLAVWAWE